MAGKAARPGHKGEAEVEQAIKRVLDVPNIATAGAQDVIDHWLVLLRSLLLKVTQAPSEASDYLVRGVVGIHCRPSGLGSRLTACSLACSIA